MPRLTTSVTRAPVVTSYRLGAFAFLVGSLVWLADGFVTAREIDIAALAYTAGSALFVDDAFFGPRRLSYRAGSVLYFIGTVLWGLGAWHVTHTVDVAAVLYLVGCAFFLADAFGLSLRRAPPSPWLTRAGALVFVGGTVAWAAASGMSVAVAAYGLGCLFFVRDAFASRRAAL